MVARHSHLVLPLNESVGAVVLALAETPVVALQPPVAILFEEAVLLVVLNHVGNDAPAASAEGVATHVTTVLHADPVEEPRLAFRKTVQGGVDAARSHSSRETVLAPCRDAPDGRRKENGASVGTGEYSVDEFVDCSVATADKRRRESGPDEENGVVE